MHAIFNPIPPFTTTNVSNSKLPSRRIYNFEEDMHGNKMSAEEGYTYVCKPFVLEQLHVSNIHPD